jgi:hypothetical protein
VEEIDMPRKSLERLTFEYLKAADDLDGAVQVCDLLPIRINRMRMVEADDHFKNTRDALGKALGGVTIMQYIQGLQQVAGKSLSLPHKSR